MNLSLKLLNALPDEQAQVEAAEQVLHRLKRLDLDAYQVEYLNAWQRFYTDHRHYLFPDDRAASEFASPCLKDVSAQSYERTAYTVKQTRQAVLQSNKERLDSVLFTATSPTTHRHKLAHECYDTAERLKQYEADVLTDLTAAIYTPCLPVLGFQPERRVDEPATVGAALGLLDFLAYVCAKYKTSQLFPPTPAPLAAISALSTKVGPLPNHTQPKTNIPESDPTSLSPADLILVEGFTLEEADRLAHAVGLINEEGIYHLGPRKLGAVVGFALALQQSRKLSGAIPDLTAVLAPRWGVQVATRKTTTQVAQHYFGLTSRALARPRLTD